LILTYLTRIGHGFLENLIFSLCIGTLTWLFIDAGRLLLWGVNRPPLFRFFVLCVVAIPSARIIGTSIALHILGIPVKNYTAIWEQNAPRFFVITVLICASITWFFWNRGKVAYLIAQAESEKARAAAIEKQAIQAQLQLLQAQIEPHMLFNTLANLQGMIAIDPPRAQHMLDQLVQYLRATLSSSRAEKITLAHEFSLMEAYLGLMSVRMGARLSYLLQLPDALADVRIPPMLLQPLIENAIKHGVEPKIEGGHIEVVATRENDMLKISVTDSGLGLDANAMHGTQVGLANVRDRLQVLYGDSASFSLTPNFPAGAIAQLDLPLQP
jgi:signal transduction histidine kinase